MSKLMTLSVVALAICSICPESMAAISLSNGTVTADTYYSGSGLDAYWAEAVTTVTIDAENLSAGQYVNVSGKITNISNPSTSWVEFGLIPKDRYDYWQDAFGGGWRPAVFDKGIYVVHWDDSGNLSLALQEGWDNWTTTTYHNKNGGSQPFGWAIPTPTQANPWDISFTMDPTQSPHESNLTITGETIYGTQPFPYGIDDGEPVSNDNDYTSCYLIAQIWSNTANASFSFEDVQAEVVPEPTTLCLLGLGGLLLGRRKSS